MVADVRIFVWDRNKESCIVVADSWDCTWTSAVVYLPVDRRADFEGLFRPTTGSRPEMPFTANSLNDRSAAHSSRRIAANLASKIPTLKM